MNFCLFFIPLTGQLRCARNTVTNADKSGSWGACAFIITTFETNGKASRERVLIASCTPARAFRSFVLSRLVMGKKRQASASFTAHRSDKNWHRAGTFWNPSPETRAMHTCAHLNCDATHQHLHRFHLRTQTTTAFVSEGKRCAALPVRCGPFAFSEDRELDCFNFPWDHHVNV